MKKLLLLLIACCTIVACQKDSTNVDDNVAIVDVMVVDQPSNVLGGLIANPPMGSNSINTDEAGKNPKHGINVRFAETGEDKFIRAYLHPTFIEKYDEENIVVGFGFRGEGGYEVAGGIYEESYTSSSSETISYYWAQDFYGLWSTDEYSSMEALADSFDSPEKEFDDKEQFFYFTMDQEATIGECGAAITSGPLGAETDISVVYNGNIDPKNAEDRGDWLRLNASLNDIKDELAGTIIFTEDDDYLYVDYAENARVYVKGIRVVSHTTTPVTLVDGAGTEYNTYKDIITFAFDEDSSTLSYAFQKGHLLRWFCGDAEEKCPAAYETKAAAVAAFKANIGLVGSYNQKIETCEGNLRVTFGSQETLSEDCGGNVHPVGTAYTFTDADGVFDMLYAVTTDTDTGDGQHTNSIAPGVYDEPCESKVAN